MAEASISDLLKRAKSGERVAADAIVQHFWEVARREAEKHLSARIRRFQSGSDIANAALRSALSYLGKPKTTVRSKDEFENLVLGIVRRKAASAARHERAGLRDERRRDGLPEDMPDDLMAKKGPTVPQLSLAKELGERISKLLMQEPDEQKKAIGLMGIVSGLSTNEIREALSSSKSGAAVPAVRTIQKCVEDAKRKLASSLREDYGELLPPKKPSKKSLANKKTAPKKSAKTPRKKTAKKPAKKSSKKPNKSQRTTKAIKKRRHE